MSFTTHTGLIIISFYPITNQKLTTAIPAFPRFTQITDTKYSKECYSRKEDTGKSSAKSPAFQKAHSNHKPSILYLMDIGKLQELSKKWELVHFQLPIQLINPTIQRMFQRLKNSDLCKILLLRLFHF